MRNKLWILLIIATTVIAIAFAISYLLGRPQPSLSHIWQLGIFGSVATYLLSFVGVWITYYAAKRLIKVSHAADNGQSELKRYLICVVVCGIIAVIAGHQLGTHKEDEDPVLGGGETIVDYVPTADERVQHGLVVFFCLCIPALYGTYQGCTERTAGRIAKSSEKTSREQSPKSG